MAIYRSVQMSFWTDGKVVDDFTPEDRYFYLYLMTNPHTNLCGCYEVSIKQIADETGYSKETVEKLLNRMSEVHKSVVYSKDTREILLVNWSKYNWTKSDKFKKPLLKEIECIKNPNFRKFLTDLCNGEDTVSIPYPYPIDTVSIPYPYRTDTTVTDTDTDADTVTDAVSITGTDSDSKTESSKGVTKASGKKKLEDTVYYPNDEKLNQAFLEYIKMRKTIRKPMTGRAIELAMKHLQEMAGIPFSGSMDNDLAIKILEQSVMNCWQGLFPIKDTGQAAGKRNILDEWRNA